MEYSVRGLSDLQRQQVAALRERVLNELPFECVDRCPLVDGSEKGEITVVATHDRYGFPVRLALCRETGLLFLLDRLTSNGYKRFYGERIYRELVAAFGREDTPRSPQEVHKYGLENARTVMRVVRGLIDLQPGARLLDIGGSTGALAEAFAKTFNVRATVVDPAQEELAFAASLGMETKEGLFEEVSFEPDEKYDLVVVNRTIEHLLDLETTFRKIRELVKPDGYVLFDVLDFMAEVERRGCAEMVSRLDHCNFLYNEMVDVFCRRIGLVVEQRMRHARLSMLYLCRIGQLDPKAKLSEERYFAVIRTLFDRDVLWEKTPRVVGYSLEERIGGRIRKVLGGKNTDAEGRAVSSKDWRKGPSR